MAMHGEQIIGGEHSGQGGQTFHAINPATGQPLEGAFHEATAAEVEHACRSAEDGFEAYRRIGPLRRAGFLEAIGQAIMALGDELLHRAMEETALPEARLTGERGRTVFQLKMFADLIREGSWVDARIDLPQADRKPLPKPDLRRMKVPLGPVAVFGASNFPLAYSVAGGDTASALAAGCSVVVKGHPAHPGTSELVAGAIVEAAARTDMPPGVFSLVHGQGIEVGRNLVIHPLIKAVGFTGSLKGGRALFDAAAGRPEPIPVYAEMGSTNPVFILPGAMAERMDAIVTGLSGSVTMGVGQFCTNPGMVVGLDGEAMTELVRKTADLMAATPAGTMVHAGIKRAFDAGVAELASVAGVSVAGRAEASAGGGGAGAGAVMFQTDAQVALGDARVSREVFGPSTVAVRCGSREKMLELASHLHGHLTVTVHGTEADFKEYEELLWILRRKAGRLVINGYPTGVEVCHAMTHGGPYPSTTDGRTTSVGPAAIERFARPMSWQNSPAAILPDELKDENPLGIWRILEGRLTREPVAHG